MRNYIYYISFLLLASLCMVSCSEQQIEGLDEGQYIQIKTSCVNLNATRAEGDPTTIMGGEEALNENLIKTIHYFLYPDNQTGKKAVMAGKVNVEQNSSADLRIQIDEEILNNLFPSYNQYCEVYLIANLPSDINIDLAGRTNTSLEELKQKIIVAFKNKKTVIDSKEYYSSEKQESFVMTGQGKAELKSRKKALAVSGQVNLDRLASKYTISVNASQFTDDNNHKWTPVMGTLQLYVNNVVSNTTLAGTIGTERFNYRYDANANDSDTEDIIPPFYSYPCQWQAHEDNALSMNIILYWQEEDPNGTPIDEPRPCYYKVFPNVAQLAPNCWYNMNLEIGVLGSFNPTDATVVTDVTCEVVSWNNGNADWAIAGGINANILNARYLVVDKNNFVLNNKNTLEIPFSSSHTCEILNLKVTNKKFVKKSGYTTVEEPYDDDLTDTANDNEWLAIVGNTIKLNHQLNNDFINSKVYDYSPFIFTFTISHVDNKNFKEEITIIQKPAISVTAELNSYREAYNKATDKSAYSYKFDQNGVNGYQYVNGYTYVSNNDDFEDEELPNYGGAQGLTGHNTHPYMYVIEVTVLPEGSDYVLGDSRDPTPFKPTDYSNFVSAPGIEGGATPRKLTNYYSTSRKTSVQNMIAPKFRIASSHGAVDYFISYEDAFNRAATYQEDGYPAGRWRVPTLAEVRFVTKLYSDGYIPSLFSSGTTYWHANGSVTPNSGGTVSPSTSTSGDNTVRCVYDDWYWENSYYPRMRSLGNHPDKYSQFTWGDEVSQTN